MALKLSPDRKKFIDVISGTGDIYTDMARFCSEFGPLLQYNHKFLVKKNFKNLIFIMVSSDFFTSFDFVVLVFFLYSQASVRMDDMKAS